MIIWIDSNQGWAGRYLPREKPMVFLPGKTWENGSRNWGKNREKPSIWEKPNICHCVHIKQWNTILFVKQRNNENKNT